MRYGITGPTHITPENRALVVTKVVSLQPNPNDEFTSGAAYGVDTEGVIAAVRAGFTVIRLTVPTGAIHNEGLVRQGQREGWLIVPTVCRSSQPHDIYMRRNDNTIRFTDVLLAFPPTSEEAGRGGLGAGTWATVRRGRKAGCEIRVYPLDGSEPWIEPAAQEQLL